MKLLAVDTTMENIVLGLHNDGKNYYYVGNPDHKKHNSVLLKEIDKLLAVNGLSIRDIDVFGAVVGPGSFTGIRIGVATVNAFALANDKKIVEITTLEQLDDGEEKLVLLDCKHDNFYAAKFGETTEYLAMTLADVNAVDVKKVYITESNPQNILLKCLQKVENNEFVEQAKPFYLKRSSAER